jgi:hypothetical protein
MTKMKIILVTAVMLTSFGMVTASAAGTVSIVKLTVSAVGSNVAMASNMNKGGAKTGSAEGTFTINTKKNTLCSVVSTVGLKNVVEAHIHTGAAGKDGADVVPFDVKMFNKKAPVCQKVAAALVAEIVANPAGYYFNVHTKVAPDGAVRGQLMKG